MGFSQFRISGLYVVGVFSGSWHRRNSSDCDVRPNHSHPRRLAGGALFLDDNLYVSRKGYALWRALLEPIVTQAVH